MKFHAMGDPQIRPARLRGSKPTSTTRAALRVSNRPEDVYAFRTPSLRNVTLTAPYGHAGAFGSLSDYVAQHAMPGSGLVGYSLSKAVLPAMKVGKPDLNPNSGAADFAAIAKAAAGVPRVNLSDDERADLVAFLKALEDPVAKAGGRMGIPKNVPSGLAIDR